MLTLPYYCTLLKFIKFFCCFFGKWKTPKSHSEINWPLGQALNCWFCLLCLPYCLAACNWERLKFVFVNELNGNRILCTDLLNIAKEYNTLSQFKMLIFLSLKTQLFMNTKYFFKINSEALKPFDVGTRVID